MRWPGRGDSAFQQTTFPADPVEAHPRASLPWLQGVFVVASAALIALALFYLRGETLRTGQRLTESLAQVLAEQTSRTLQSIDERLKLAASDLAAMEMEGVLNETTARAMLRDQLRGLPFVRAIWVVDPQGVIVLDSDVGNIGLSVADRTYVQVYRQHPETGFFIGPVVRSRSTGTWLMSASRPLVDRSGRNRGIIVAAVEPPYFESVWRGIDLGEGGAVSLFSRNGQLMVRSPPDDQAMGKDYSQISLFTHYLLKAPQGSTVVHSAIDNLERVIAWRVLPSFPELVIAVGSPYDALLAPWRRFATLTTAVWLAAVLAAAVLARLLQSQSRRHERHELRYRQLAQAMPQIVFMADPQGQVRFINDRWTEATGRPPETALGTGWADFIHADDRKESLRVMGRMMEAGFEFQREHRLLFHDGIYRWQLLRAVPARDAAGQVVSWHGTSTDIDDLKQAQDQLKAQADLLSMASQLARMGAWVVDPVQQTITWSDEASAILDMPPGSKPSLEQVFKLFAPRSRERTVQAVEECMEHGTPFDVEVEMFTATGRPVWIRSIGRAVRDDSGKVVRIEGAQQDITQRVRLMAQVQELNFGLEEKIARRTTELRANEAALRIANDQLRAFSYSVSHDLQSPLQRMASFAQLLEGELGTEAPRRAQHYLSRIRANADYMSQLIEGLLALAQVSEIEMVIGGVNLSDLASEILDGLQAEHPQRRVAWQVQAGLTLTGDARLMRSVMENLLGNAWKFTAHHDPTSIVVGGSSEKGEFFVSDTGAGFDMAYADKLFGTFQRLHRTDEFEGTGIGLATVARAIARHGGRIWAEAQPGKGATFHFFVPPPGA